MTCPSPNLTLLKHLVSPEEPLDVNVSIHMDNVWVDVPGAFVYVVDPVVHPFAGEERMRRLYLDENYLDIQVCNSAS